MHVRDGQISGGTEEIMRKLLESAHADGYEDGYRAGIQRAVALMQQAGHFEMSVKVLTTGDADIATHHAQRPLAA
jgi:hypothetical protein